MTVLHSVSVRQPLPALSSRELEVLLAWLKAPSKEDAAEHLKQVRRRSASADERAAADAAYRAALDAVLRDEQGLPPLKAGTDPVTGEVPVVPPAAGAPAPDADEGAPEPDREPAPDGDHEG